MSMTCEQGPRPFFLQTSRILLGRGTLKESPMCLCRAQVPTFQGRSVGGEGVRGSSWLGL